MNLLYSNDRPGEYPDSWYAATAGPYGSFPELKGETRAEVCVVGGGFTGLSTALHLARAGMDVALIEAHRVGFGASGRNGGQVCSGHQRDQNHLEKRYGTEFARKLWNVGEDAKTLVRTLLSEHRINAKWRDGIARADWTEKGARTSQAYAHKLRQEYGYEAVEPLSRKGIRSLVGSGSFQGGMIDWGAGHLHPLRFAGARAGGFHRRGPHIRALRSPEGRGRNHDDGKWPHARGSHRAGLQRVYRGPQSPRRDAYNASQ